MNPIVSLGAVWWALKGTARAAIGLRVWTPLLSFTVVRMAVLIVLVFFHHPWISGVGPWTVETLGGPEALRYPDHLFALPEIFAAVDRGVHLVVAPFAFGFTAILLAAVFLRGHDDSRIRRIANARIGHLFLLVAFWASIDLATTSLGSLLPDVMQGTGGVIGLFLLFVKLGVLTVLRTPFVFALPATAVLGDDAWAALRRSVRIASEHPVAAVTLAAVHAIAALPFLTMLGPVGRSRLAATPEYSVALLSLQILVELIVQFAVLGASTRFLLWKAGSKR